jgi:hypoxia up-regulated 1
MVLHMGLMNIFCYRGTITREKFEELCQDLWEEALNPVKEVLTHSGMKIDDIYALELIGGATRVPKLQVIKLIYHLTSI